MSKHENEILNQRQNATNERSAAARLDSETERELYTLYRAYFRTADTARAWDPWRDIPWESEAPAPSEALREAALTLYRESLFLPDYGAAVLRLLRSSRGRAWFWTRWSYEEGKRLLGLHEWLTRRAGIADSELCALADDLLSTGRWTPPTEDAIGVFLDALLWELHEIEQGETLRAQARAEGDAALVTLLERILTDEAAQRDFMVDSLRLIARRHAPEIAHALAQLAATYESPTLPERLGTFLELAPA